MGLFHEIVDRGITAEQLAAAIEAAGKAPQVGGRLTSESDGRGGFAINETRGYRLTPDVRVGMVMDKGPNGEKDFGDARYWILSLVSTDGGGNKPTTWAQDGSLADNFVTATHAFEAKSGTHSLAAGDMVLLLHFATVDHGYDIYVCVGLSSSLKWAKLQEDPSPGTSVVSAKDCSEDGTVPAGAPTISLAWGGTPPGTSSSKPPLYVPYASGDVVLYNPFPMSGGSLSLANPIAGVVHDIPIRGGALRSILQVTGVDGAGNPINCGFDFLRSHNP